MFRTGHGFLTAAICITSWYFLLTHGAGSVTSCPRGCECHTNQDDGHVTVYCLATPDETFRMPRVLPFATRIFILLVTDNDWNFGNQTFDDASWTNLTHFQLSGIRTPWNMHNLTFINLANLQYLIIHDCGLAGIDSGTFSYLDNLVHFDLSGNNFLLFDDVARGLEGFQATTLRLLNVSSIHNGERTSLATIHKSFLGPLRHSKVTVIDLSWTRLTILDSPLVSFIFHVEVFNISGTSIASFIECMSEFAFLPNLQVLEFSHWPSYAQGDSRTKRSDLPNDMSTYERWACNSTYVDKLKVNGCYRIPPNMHTAMIHHLDLESTYFKASSALCFHPENSLVYLFLYSSHMPYFYFTGLHKVTVLDLTDATVDVLVPNMLQDFPSLNDVRLAGMGLSRLKESGLSQLFLIHQQLRRIDMSRNDLIFVPSQLVKENVDLDHLDLSGNKLLLFDIDISNIMHIQMINIAGNVLKTIDITVLEQLDTHSKHQMNSTNLTVILSNNDFTCDCSAAPFIAWLQTTHVIIPGKQQLQCSQSNVTLIGGKAISDLQCEHKPINLYVVIIPVVLVLVVLAGIVVVGTLFYRKYTRNLPRDLYIDMPIEELAACEYLVYVSHLEEGDDHAFVRDKLYPHLIHELHKLAPNHDEQKLVHVQAQLQSLAGRPIFDLIDNVVKSSRVIIVVASKDSLQTRDCGYAV
jgi:hypothetical protein